MLLLQHSIFAFACCDKLHSNLYAATTCTTSDGVLSLYIISSHIDDADDNVDDDIGFGHRTSSLSLFLGTVDRLEGNTTVMVVRLVETTTTATAAAAVGAYRRFGAN